MSQVLLKESKMRNFWFYVIKINKNNSDSPHQNYKKFDNDIMTDDECNTESRFHKSNMFTLTDNLHAPELVIVIMGFQQTVQKPMYLVENIWLSEIIWLYGPRKQHTYWNVSTTCLDSNFKILYNHENHLHSTWVSLWIQQTLHRMSVRQHNQLLQFQHSRR